MTRISRPISHQVLAQTPFPPTFLVSQGTPHLLDAVLNSLTVFSTTIPIIRWASAARRCGCTFSSSMPYSGKSIATPRRRKPTGTLRREHAMRFNLSSISIPDLRPSTIPRDFIPTRIWGTGLICSLNESIHELFRSLLHGKSTLASPQSAFWLCKWPLKADST